MVYGPIRLLVVDDHPVVRDGVRSAMADRYFQWAASRQVVVLEATRPHVELYRCAMEAEGLAASTIDRRLLTVCGFYRFAHINGRVASNSAQYVRRPKVCSSASTGGASPRRAAPTSKTSVHSAG